MTTTINVDENENGRKIGMHFGQVRDTVHDKFDSVKEKPQFRVAKIDLYELFLLSMPQQFRQHYNCACCRSFVNKYGRLVTINEEGKTESSMFGFDPEQTSIHPYFAAGLRAIRKKVESMPIIGIYFDDKAEYGTPNSYENQQAYELGYGDPGAIIWSHLYATPAVARVYTDTHQTAGQARDISLHDHKTMKRAMAEFSPPLLQQAVDVLKSEGVDRSERYLAPAQFLHSLASTLDGVRDHNKRDNLVWLAIADKPQGFLKPRAGMMGQLLEGLKEGKPFEVIKRSFNEKVASDKLLRPTKAPSNGQINQAEKLVKNMGIESAFPRKFARMIDYPEQGFVWRPAAPAGEAKTSGKASDGLFASLRTAEKNDRNTITPTTMNLGLMSWDKFKRLHLEDAAKIELMTTRDMNLGGITDAVDPNSKPLFRWDNPDRGQPNKFSWYVYKNEQKVSSFNLPYRQWVEVSAIVHAPWLLHGMTPAMPEGIMWVLKGARDVEHEDRMGLGLFPEILRSELFSIRKTMEAFSDKNDLQGFDEGDMLGVPMQSMLPYPIRVATKTGTTKLVNIDRWD